MCFLLELLWRDLSIILYVEHYFEHEAYIGRFEKHWSIVPKPSADCWR